MAMDRFRWTMMRMMMSSQLNLCRSAVSCTKLKSKSNESNLTKRSEEGGFDYSASSTSRQTQNRPADEPTIGSRSDCPIQNTQTN